MELTADEWAELRALVNEEISALAEMSRPTVDLWLARYGAERISGLVDRPRGAGREQVPAAIRARILAASRTSPPADTGLSHWSSREMAAFITRTTGVYVSHHYIATLWQETGLQPHRQGTFKVSKDPAFAEKVADIVGLYLVSRDAVNLTLHCYPAAS